MNCDGVWSVEMEGLYGWERIATAFMKNGDYYAASANHYSVGSYERDGDDLKISTVVRQYGDVRPVFGKKSKEKMEVVINGRIKKNKISGTSNAKGSKDYDVFVRFTRLDTLK